MTPAPRKKRPTPKRDHPERGGGTKQRPEAAGSKRGADRDSARLSSPLDAAADVARLLVKASEVTVGEGIETARRFAHSSESTVIGAVERGVDTAYMVIDEYMSRGRRAAGRHHERKNGSDTMAQDSSHRHGWTSDYGQMPPFMAPWMATAKLWTDAMAQMAPGGPAMGRAWMDQMMSMWAPWWGAGAALAPRLSFEVSSAKPAEVSATLDPMAYFCKLSVGELKPADGAEHPPITDVGITSSSGHVCVRVSVTDRQPIGRYCAEVHDEPGGARRGHVEVTVKARAGAAANKKK